MIYTCSLGQVISTREEPDLYKRKGGWYTFAEAACTHIPLDRLYDKRDIFDTYLLNTVVELMMVFYRFNFCFNLSIIGDLGIISYILIFDHDSMPFIILKVVRRMSFEILPPPFRQHPQSTGMYMYVQWVGLNVTWLVLDILTYT